MQEVNEQLLRKILHIGATVTISYTDEQGQIYYVCSEGFTTHKIRLRSPQYIKQQGKLHSCLFKIVPPFSFDEYAKSRQSYQKMLNLDGNNQRDARMEFPKLLKSMDDESSMNVEQYNKLKGQAIFFGQSVQFIHEASNKYLSFIRNQISDYDNDGWKCTLKQEHSEDTFFKFMSSFSFQQETGGYIFDEDTVYIISSNEQGLNATSRKPNTQKRELNLGLEKKSFWKIKMFSKYMQDSQKYLQVFDVVWISYAELNLNLIVQKYTPHQEKKFLKFEQGEDTQKFNQFVGDSNGMFVIENVEDMNSDDFIDGGFVQWNTLYRLKHLTSKYYLHLESIDTTINLIATDNIKEASLFQFEKIFQNSIPYMESDCYFRMSALSDQRELWLRTESVEPNQIYIREGDNFIDSIFVPAFEMEKKEENVFNLTKASANDVRLTQYILSCMKTLKRSEEYLQVDLNQRDQFQQKEFQNIYKRLLGRSIDLENCLSDLYALCYNKLQGYVAFEEEYGSVYQHIQNLLKEQYFFEALVRIAVLCFPTVDTLRLATQYQEPVKVTTVLANSQKDLLENQIIQKFVERKKSICLKVYQLIEAMCVSNNINQQYCSKYLPIFSMQSMYLPGAINTTLAIIKEYEELLLTLNKDTGIQNLNITPSAKTPGSKPKKTIQVTNSKKNVDYDSQYAEICLCALRNTHISRQWDLILFFSSNLKQQIFEKRIEILQFLKQSAILEGRGLNINQELAYKYILSNQNVFEDEILIRIKSDGPQLKVYRGEDEKTLLDYYHEHRNPQNKNPYLIPYICESMRFYAIMSNSRNYTWKKFAENFFNVESLIENIQNDQYEVEIRSIICNLLNKLYVDQEPRRIIVWPELCKVVHTEKRGRNLNNTMLSEGKYGNKQVRADPVDIGRVKEKLLGYLKEMAKRIDKNTNMIDLQQGPNEKKPKLQEIYENSYGVYNILTLEVTRLFKLLVLFGKYAIRLGTANETMEWNQELFMNIRSLLALLEFNSLYPETRKLMLKQRQKDNEQEDILNPFRLFGKKNVKKLEENKQVFKGDDDVDDPSQGEAFQKLVMLQNIKMNEFMYKQENVNDTLIKLEVCDILDYYLDSKIDFYLNNLKYMFSEWVYKLQLFDKVINGQLDIDQISDREKIEQQFKSEIKESINQILPKIMKTGTSVDSTDLKKPDQNQYLAFMNLANFKKSDNLAKDLEAINLESVMNFSIFPSLISIFCLNQNIELETKILQVLTRLYNQRYEFAELSSQLLILFDDVNINIFKKCKKKIQFLGKCVDESETWVQNLGQDEQHIETLRQVQNHFQFFTDLLFKGSSLNEDSEIEKSNSDIIDPIRQDIMKHLKVDKLAVDLIKDSVFMVEQETNPYYLDKLKEMFRVTLRFLTLFVKTNPNNQFLMSKHITSLITNLHTDLGQVELLCEIFRNNKMICLERSVEVIDDFVRLIISNGRQARFLEFFLVVMQINTDYLSQNQKAVLNLFIVPKFKYQLFYMQKSEFKNYPIFDFQPKIVDNNVNYLDEPYKYHAKFIEVCAACTIGKEGLLSAENKLKETLTFKYLMELLLEEDMLTQQIEKQQDEEDQVIQFGPKKQEIQIPSSEVDPEKITLLKPAILQLLFYTYLESEKISEEIFQCLGDIIKFIKKERERIQFYKNSIPQYQEYLFDYFMLVVNGFIKVFNRELGSQALTSGSQLQKQSVQFQDQMEKLRNQLTPQFTNQFILTLRQKNLLDIFIKENIMQEDQNKLNLEEQDDLLQRQIRQPTFKKLPKKQKTIQTSRRELSTDQIWKELWNIFLAQFLNSNELQTEIQKEQQIFAKAVYKVDEIFKEDKTIYQQINKTSIFKRLIAFLEKSSNSNITTFKLILKVLSNYITITEIPEDTLEQDIQALKEKQKIDNQNFLNSNNAMQMSLTLLSGECPDIIFNDLIVFGIDLLDGGNPDVQQAVWSFFQNFPSSEMFFQRLHLQFQKERDCIGKADESIQSYSFQQQSNLMNNILRLLQLFAEGHFTELQEYMHEQTFNHHSYDLIQDFIELLTAYMSKMNQDYYKNMIQNFDTINEYIQGPCRINQYALIQANFLDLANQLYGIDELLQEFDRQVENEPFKTEQTEDFNDEIQQYFPRWMMSQLKYKCSITLISLLEARESEEIVERMMKSLNIESLKMNMINIYYLFQMDYNKQYSEDIFNHFSLSEDSSEDDRAFIIETGFNLYFLYTIFQKTKNPLLGRKNKADEQEDLQQKFENNPFFKFFFKLALSILQSIQESLEKAMRLAFQNSNPTALEKKNRFLSIRENILKDSMQFYSSRTASIEIMFDDKNLEETYFYIPPYCHLDDEAKDKFNENANRASNKAKVTSLVNEASEIITTMKLNYKIQVWLNKIKTLEVIIENIDLLRDIEFLLAIIINIFIFGWYQKGKVDDEYTSNDDFPYQTQVNVLGILSIVLSILIVAFFLSRNAPLLLEKAWSGVENDKLNIFNYLLRIMKTIYYFITDFFALYYILYGTAAVLGRFLHPFFFSFHLFEVMIRFPVLLNVIKSVWIPKQQILYTGLLLLIFMYVFTVFGYLVLYDSQQPDFCDSMWICFLTVLDAAFKYDSGIGGQLANPHEVYADSNGMLVVRFLYDNIFNILVIIVMLNIVSGIIIDTFGELREKLLEYRQDLENLCFICGYDKETIEKESINLQNFSDHIKYEHYQWNYLYYIAYLQDKDPTEYTGVESYVAGKLEKEDITWFPLNKALCLKKRQEDENVLVMSLEQIQEQSKKLQSSLSGIQQEIDGTD